MAFRKVQNWNKARLPASKVWVEYFKTSDFLILTCSPQKYRRQDLETVTRSMSSASVNIRIPNSPVRGGTHTPVHASCQTLPDVNASLLFIASSLTSAHASKYFLCSFCMMLIYYSYLCDQMQGRILTEVSACCKSDSIVTRCCWLRQTCLESDRRYIIPEETDRWTTHLYFCLLCRSFL